MEILLTILLFGSLSTWITGTGAEEYPWSDKWVCALAVSMGVTVLSAVACALLLIWK